MLSENKLQKRTLGSNPSQTVNDTQDTNNNDTLYNLIKLGVAGLATYGIYKTGALKPVTKGLLELADTVAKEGGDRAATTLKAVKQWSNLKHLDASQLARSTSQSHPIPNRSLFRKRDSSLLYDITQDIQSGKMDNLRILARDTQEDMDLLFKMIAEKADDRIKQRARYSDTDLAYRIKELKSMVKELEREGNPYEQVQIRARMNQAFMDTLTTTKEEAERELKESGYRKLVLPDVSELKIEDGVRVLRKKEGISSDIEIDDLLDEVNNLFRSGDIGYMKDGKRVMPFSSGDWKNIVIDSSMRIDEDGHIIDYRMSKNDMIDFAHSLANDFKLPLVQFNPFKSLFGLDKVGRRQPLMALINNNQIDPNITRLGGRTTIKEWAKETLGDAFENSNVAVVNGKAIMVGSDGEVVEVADRLKLHNITYSDGAYGLKPVVNAQRQMAGMSLNEYPELTKEQIDNLSNFEKIKYWIGNNLDLGRMENHIEGEKSAWSLDTGTSIDEMTDKFISWATDRKLFQTTGFEYDSISEYMQEFQKYNYKTVFGEGFAQYTGKNGKLITPNMYTTSKEGFKLIESAKLFQEGNTSGALYELKGFFGQFASGRNKATNTMGEFFTERTGYAWTVMNNLSEGLGGSSKLLGLGIDSKNGPVQLGANLLLKRALPVYGLLQLPGIINYLSEPFFGKEDETGNHDNITKWLMRGVKKFDISAHHAMDLTSATKVFKFLGDMTPGSEQISELPGIHALGLGQTEEERKDYIENGYDPVRKGRWWGSGNTPFTGGKIMYFRPNLYRRVEADVDFSDSKWGSRQEYYNNTWFPNPVNPLAPINHFITDRHHYDKKHYYDRPYLQTAPEGSNIPLIGPLFSQTVGKVIMPPKKMHMDYWQNGFQINPLDEEKSPLLTEGKLSNVLYHQNTMFGSRDHIYTPQTFDNSKVDTTTYNQIQIEQAIINKNYQDKLNIAAYQAKQVVSKSYQDNAGINFQTTSILPTRTYDKYNTPYEVYSTPSGALNIVDIPDDLNLYNVNRDLQSYSINKIIGTNKRVNITPNQGAGIPVGNDNQLIDNAFVYGLGEQYNWTGEIAGLKGFAFQQFVTGHANERARIIEDSGYAYSVNNDFWEANMGGLGANLSEISRRFLPKRNNNTEYVNPIRNTMPSWMPGSSYFTDFKHGDPYSKIDNGEERLPGEGYERLHNIKGLMEFNIGSSSIGYEKEYIIRHMLKQDQDKNTFEEDTLETGTRIHNQLEKAWKDAGIAFSTEGEIKDTRNGIIGYYDAMVHDMSSPTGVGIVDIKTTSAKKLEEIRKSGQPLEHHRRQVNYYLWATGNEKSKGYIYYVDKENLNNNYTVGFNYDEERLKDTLNNVYEARKTIRESVDKGIIGRGELYSTLDRYRILADVAPYSQEFQDVKAQLSKEDLSPEQHKEFTAINERIKQQKEPLRVYNYRFKTSNLKTETVTVSKIIDNNTIVTKEYGKQHSVKFAGIRVHESNSDMYDDKYTQNEAASRKIKKYIRPGQKIQISYDADEHNKYSKDSTHSIRAVVSSHGKNVNQILLNQGHAKEQENDNSPAGIRARYTKGEIAFGSAMETMTHDVIGSIPFVGSKILQVRSPYEQYRKREVYSKDFQSWNHPIRDMLIPSIQENVADNRAFGLGGIVMGAFLGSMFGKGTYGKLVGATVGGLMPAIGKILVAPQYTKDRNWIPERRRKQEELNEYVDVLKYVKNMRLYEKYKIKALKEDNFDVDKFIESKEAIGVQNKLKQQELTDYKRKVKLDFKHRDRYNFKYGDPKYTQSSMSRKDTISAINKEIAELQSQRKVTKVPENALLAIDFKQTADKTMYGFKPGDSLVNIMSALPKKERQYFKHFMDAPEEEKDKILKIAPSYLRRALQSTWGLPVDEKPSLNEYFTKHGLPDASWIGWDESTNLDDIKVKLVHLNKMDPGEFDVWDDNKRQADQTNIPIPVINAHNSSHMTRIKLQQILGKAGYEDVQILTSNNPNGNSTRMNIKYDSRNDVAQQISNLAI